MPLYAAHVPARLQATWAEFARRGGLSDQKIKKGTFIKVEKLRFWESPIKILNVMGTPNIRYFWRTWNYIMFLQIIIEKLSENVSLSEIL